LTAVERHHDGKLEEKEGEQEEGFPGTEASPSTGNFWLMKYRK
jgi:hypothetical protein